jgi:LPXTG-motif cell wall-anchored protein
MTAMGHLAAGNRISGYELTTANPMRALPATGSHRNSAWHLVGILLLAIAGCALRPRW